MFGNRRHILAKTIATFRYWFIKVRKSFSSTNFAKFTEKEGTRVSVFYLKNIVIDAKIYTEGRLKLGCRSFSSTFLKYFEGPIRPSKVGISLKNLEPATKIFRIKQRVGAVFYAQTRIQKGMFVWLAVKAQREIKYPKNTNIVAVHQRWGAAELRNEILGCQAVMRKRSNFSRVTRSAISLKNRRDFEWEHRMSKIKNRGAVRNRPSIFLLFNY